MPFHGRHVALHTVLLVGEGKTEYAFLQHIKSLYIHRGCGVSVKVRDAHGKGPDHVVDYAIRQRRNASYNRVVVLLDTDLPITDKVRKRAKSKKIQIIGSTPCIEGLLLRILDKHVPATSSDCKAQRGSILPVRLTLTEDFQALLPKDLLDERRTDVPELNQLLDYLSFAE